MLSALGLQTGSNVPSMHATSVPRTEPGPEQVVPLGESTIASTLQFLIPPSVHGIPPSIASRPLLQRHHFLQITPEEPGSYFFLNPEHPSQDTSKVLSTLNELADQNMEDLARSVLYSTDGEDVLSHVITAAPGAIQFVFIWEKPDDDSEKTGWKYLDVKPFSPSSGLYRSLEEAEEARLRVESTKSSLARSASGNSIADDSYWSAYDNVAPSASKGPTHFPNGVASLVRDQSATGLSQRSASPRREEAYWDRYGYDSDDDEGGDVPPSNLAPPLAQAQASAIREELRFLGLQTNQHVQAQVWTAGSSRFSPEDLSEALAMHLQPELAASSDVAQGLTVNLDTPPSKESLPRAASEPVSPPEGDHASTFSDPSVEQEPSGAAGINAGTSISEKAVLDATRDIYNLWRSTRSSQSGDSSEDKKAFLVLVNRSLADL
jgi:hypothetical protein